jgi:hypothetical protein
LLYNARLIYDSTGGEMNKNILVFVLMCVTLMLFGCFRPIAPDVVDEDVATVVMTSNAGLINRPLVGGGDDWYAVPLEPVVLLFGKGRDMYGNAVGLSDDTDWSISDFTIIADLKNEYDTVYTPGDEFRRKGLSYYGINNAVVWYPLWTGGIDGFTGLPYSPFPGVGRYPYFGCNTTVSVGPFHQQYATIYARAVASKIFVRITAPSKGGGTYTLVLPGRSPQASNVFTDVGVGSHGDIDIVWEDGGDREVYTVTIPVDWFIARGEWRIAVSGTSGCSSKTHGIFDTLL